MQMPCNPCRKRTGPRLVREGWSLKSYTSENKKAKGEAGLFGHEKNDKRKENGCSGQIFFLLKEKNQNSWKGECRPI